MQTDSRWRFWLGIALSVIIPLVVLLVSVSDHPTVPSEDAFITFRYARNLANGHGLVWNIGDRPVEGSTEFLWAATLASAYKLGIPPDTAARGLNLVLTLASTVLVSGAAYALSRARVLAALFAGGAFAAGPAAYYVSSGFATPLFTLWLIVLFVCMVGLAFYSDHSRVRAGALLLFPLTCLFLGMTRPEGVIFDGLAILSIAVAVNPANRRLLARNVLLLFVLPGLIYFTWRWSYFGYPLPNTFYVKGGDSLLHLRYWRNIYDLFKFMAPLLLLIGLGLALERRAAAYRELVVLAPVLIFPWAYLLIEQTQNIGMRFQYPVFPVYLIASALALGKMRPSGPALRSFRDLREWGWMLASIALALLALFLSVDRTLLIEALILAIFVLKAIEDRAPAFQPVTASSFVLIVLSLTVLYANLGFRLADAFQRMQYDDRAVIAQALQPFAPKGYTIVASEAGWIPYFSEWRTIDPLGLSDAYIAHHGLTTSYLEAENPDIIMWHDVENPDPPRWTEMVRFLKDYSQQHSYILAATIERRGPKDVHIYYVRPDNPEADKLIRTIAGQPGFIYDNGAP